MDHTVSLKSNRIFRRLYQKGTHTAAAHLVLYCRRNNVGKNRIGITVSTKLGHAVVRNRVRRQIREIYRTNEAEFAAGWDIIAVARVKAVGADYHILEEEFLHLAGILGIKK